MTRTLLNYLCEPVTKAPLTLTDEVMDSIGQIISGLLVSSSGASFPIINGIPRFVWEKNDLQTVESFGDEWNYFNFTDFKAHWLNHTVSNTFGSSAVFRDKLVVDAGGGSGAQTLWMLESGARHVIMLELSHSVDGVVQQNLSPLGFESYDVVQCSIDQPPLRDRIIDGIVLCHNVIQHTQSVEKTARALFALVGQGGEFVFNCYTRTEKRSVLRWMKSRMIYRPLRGVLSRCPFGAILTYSHIMAVLRSLPAIGWVIEKAGFCLRGDVPRTGKFWQHLAHSYRATVLNTFDLFGSHAYQHLKTESELRKLIKELQPDETKVKNVDRTFSTPRPIGCLFRIFR